MPIEFGRQVCGSLSEASAREWLVTDGLGGYAMGTVAGLRTRRYHGLLMVAGEAAGGDAGVSRRMLGLATLDPTLVVGDRRIRLATDEWASGVVDPAGYIELESFTLTLGIPKWRWVIGDITFEREVAMVHGRPAVAVRHRLVHAPGPVRVELTPLCTWRDGHSDRHAGPRVAPTPRSHHVDVFADDAVNRLEVRVADALPGVEQVPLILEVRIGRNRVGNHSAAK